MGTSGASCLRLYPYRTCSWLGVVRIVTDPVGAAPTHCRLAVPSLPVDAVVDFWRALGPGGQAALVLGVLGLLGLGPLLLRWRDRPRLRVSLRHVGITDDDNGVVLEVANFGGRATSLYPVVRVRALVVNFRRRVWYPGEVTRLLPAAWRQRADAALRRAAVPIEWAGYRVALEYDVHPGQPLRVEAHQGTQEVRSGPRRPREIHALTLFRVFHVREEGRRRPCKVYTTYHPRKRVSRLRYWLARVRCQVLGPPKSGGGTTLDDWLADQLARD